MQSHNNKRPTEDNVQDPRNKRSRIMTNPPPPPLPPYAMGSNVLPVQQPGNYFLPNPSDPAAVCRFLSNSSPMDIYNKSIDIITAVHFSLENEIARLRQKIDDTAAMYRAENERLKQLLQDLTPLQKESTRLQQLAQEREAELKAANNELELLKSGKKCEMLETDLDNLQGDLDETRERLEQESAELKRRRKLDTELLKLYGVLDGLLAERECEGNEYGDGV